MQKFYLPFTYKQQTDGAIIAAETWCKNEKDCLSQIHQKLPALCQIVEAYLIEWQNPDAPMELIVGNPDATDARLLEMLTSQRNNKLRPALEKAQARRMNKPRVRLKHMALVPMKPKVEKPLPYRPFIVRPAIEYRNMYWRIA